MKSAMNAKGTAVAVLAACLAVAVPGDRVSAVEPTTAPAYQAAGDRPTAGRPAPHSTTRPTPFGNRVVRLRDLGLAGPDWPQIPADQLPGPEEWQAVAEFAKENFPNRFKLFEELQTSRGEDNALVQVLRARFYGRYRLLMRIQDRMRDLYDSAIKQGKLEDEAWAAVMAYRKKRNDPKLDSAMRDKVNALVKNLLEERSDRLKKLQEAIADEQKQLDSDKDNVDELVDRQIRVLSGDDPNFGRDGRGTGGGWGAWGGGGGPNWNRGNFGRDGQRPPPATRPRND